MVTITQENQVEIGDCVGALLAILRPARPVLTALGQVHDAYVVIATDPDDDLPGLWLSPSHVADIAALHAWLDINEHAEIVTGLEPDADWALEREAERRGMPMSRLLGEIANEHARTFVNR